ncbi:unconventional myosin-IXb-like [Paramormyrops kingsleyae]|uniref:unconventional myosin-IXb-like n=1 Tax=Paramormyrops kingsleyae TaxID=1676925 RepID=UPI003B96F96B
MSSSSSDSLLLPRVAREEHHNQMSTHSLAIIFSSTFLCSPDTMNSPEIMKDMNKATMCLELILNEQMRSYEKLKELEQLEYPEALAMKQPKRQDTKPQSLRSRLIYGFL